MNILRPHNRLGAVVLLLVALAACGRQGSETSRALPPPPTVASTVPEPSTTTTSTSTTTVPESTTTTTAPVPATTPTTAAPRARPATTVVTEPVAEPVAAEPTTTTTTAVATVTPPPEPARVATSHGGPVRDHVSLVDNLRARGLTVTPLEPVVQPFLRGDGTMLAVSGAGIGPAQVQSFQYESAQAAAADAATLTPECNPGTTRIMWVGPPHFYRAGRVLAIYVGSDTGMTGLLTELLGPQVCGS
jgi:predicted small lipoprotein YifL